MPGTTPQLPLFDASPAPPPVAGRTVLEFFAGVGLARIGFEQAGWRVVWANDFDEMKRRQYEGHFGPSPHLSGEDIHTLADRPDELPTALLAHASFPCTDLSLAGGRRGLNAGQSSAYWGFHRLLENLADRRPPLVLLENVTGLVSSHGGADFRAAVSALDDLGYAVDALVLDAARFVPQSRPRLFILGKPRNTTRQGEPPAEPAANWEGEAPAEPTRDTDAKARQEPRPPEHSPLRPKKLLDAINANADLAWDLATLPDPPDSSPTKLKDLLDNVPDDSPQWWDAERAEYLLNQMSDRHRAIADKMIAGRRWSAGGVFRRVRNGKSMAELRTDGLAGCLRTPKGGSGRQILFQAGHGRYRVRLLNANECARLMGADGYRVTGTLNQALFGFGDGVCVSVVRWITEKYLNPLAKELATTPKDQGQR